MMKKGNPRLTIRFPSEHWIWSIKDKKERNAIIRTALEQYKEKERLTENLRKIIAETNADIIAKLNNTQPAPAESKDNDLHEQLLDDMDKFLDF